MAEGRELPYPDVDISAVRKYANGRANMSSVRGVAGEIGIRNTSLDKFLSGSEPYARNRKLLIEWYLRDHRVRPVRPDVEVLLAGAADAAPENPDGLVEALLSDLRGEARTEARLKITTALAQGYRRMGHPEPEWLWAR